MSLSFLSCNCLPCIASVSSASSFLAISSFPIVYWVATIVIFELSCWILSWRLRISQYRSSSSLAYRNTRTRRRKRISTIKILEYYSEQTATHHFRYAEHFTFNMRYCKNTSLSICGIVRTHYFQLGLCNTIPVGCITVTIVTVEQHINSTCVYSICTMCFEKNSHDMVLKYM